MIRYRYVYIYIHIYPYLWHRSHRLVSDPGLRSTPLDAHRDGNVSPSSFRTNYDTEEELFQFMLHNSTLPGRTHDPAPLPYHNLTWSRIFNSFHRPLCLRQGATGDSVIISGFSWNTYFDRYLPVRYFTLSSVTLRYIPSFSNCLRYFPLVSADLPFFQRNHRYLLLNHR